MEKAKIKLEILGLSYSQTQTGAYALVLGESDGKRRLPIIIGNFEAQAIAIELESMRPSRPLTHDIFKTFADTFEIKVNEVIVYNLVEGIFFAKLLCQRGSEEPIEIDTRTSDAIALAVRFNCPIYTYEFILGSAGIILDDDEIESLSEDIPAAEIPKISATSGRYGSMPLEELEVELEKALSEEDYEKASEIRDEINKRK
ncbi:MAG: bifunctional nuclease family protein [Flavobacteriales bacterium]|nr:bifunctional nuclease family protein [Flavobacteriales bacterium]